MTAFTAQRLHQVGHEHHRISRERAVQGSNLPPSGLEPDVPPLELTTRDRSINQCAVEDSNLRSPHGTPALQAGAIAAPPTARSLDSLEHNSRLTAHNSK